MSEAQILKTSVEEPHGFQLPCSLLSPLACSGPEDISGPPHAKCGYVFKYSKHPLTCSLWTMSSLLLPNCSNLFIFLAKHRWSEIWKDNQSADKWKRSLLSYQAGSAEQKFLFSILRTLGEVPSPDSVGKGSTWRVSREGSQIPELRVHRAMRINSSTSD